VTLLQGHRTKLNETKNNNKQKGQKRQQSVVVDRQQLYCVVQSRSPSHCQTTAEKRAFSWRENIVSDGAFLTDDGRLFHSCADATEKARSPSVELRRKVDTEN